MRCSDGLASGNRAVSNVRRTQRIRYRRASATSSGFSARSSGTTRPSSASEIPISSRLPNWSWIESLAIAATLPAARPGARDGRQRAPGRTAGLRGGLQAVDASGGPAIAQGGPAHQGTSNSGGTRPRRRPPARPTRARNAHLACDRTADYRGGGCSRDSRRSGAFAQRAGVELECAACARL